MWYAAIYLDKLYTLEPFNDFDDAYEAYCDWMGSQFTEQQRVNCKFRGVFHEDELKEYQK